MTSLKMLRSVAARWPQASSAWSSAGAPFGVRPSQAWLVRAAARQPYLLRARPTEPCACSVRFIASSVRPREMGQKGPRAPNVKKTRFFSKDTAPTNRKGLRRPGVSLKDPSEATLRQREFEASRRLGRRINAVHEAATVEEKSKAYDAAKLYFESTIPRNLKLANAILWNHLITGALSAGKQREAFKVYNQMKKSGVQPNARTYVAFFRGMRIQQKQGSELSASLVDALINELHKLREMVTGEVLGLSRAGGFGGRVTAESVAISDPGAERSDLEWEQLQTARSSGRMRFTRHKVIKSSRSDWTPLLQAYTLAFPLLAHMRREEQAWQLYVELSRRSPETGKYVKPFPHRAIFSSVLANLWGQMGVKPASSAAAKAAPKRPAADDSTQDDAGPRLSAFRAAEAAAEVREKASLWKERMRAVITAWTEQLQRANTSMLYRRFVESIEMDALMLFQVIRALHMIDTPHAAAWAIDIFQQIVGWAPSDRRQLWTNTDLVRRTLSERDGDTPLPAAEMLRLLQECWERSEQPWPWEDIEPRFKETILAPKEGFRLGKGATSAPRMGPITGLSPSLHAEA